MNNISSIEAGPEILSMMQPWVQANEALAERWERFENSNLNLSSMIDEPRSSSGEYKPLAGLPIEELYTGLEALQEDEILALQAMIAQEELVPTPEDSKKDPLDIVEAVKTGLIETKERRWAAVHGHLFRGLAVEIRPVDEEDPVRYATEGPRGSRQGSLSSGYVRGLITALSITGKGSITLEEGYRWFSGAKPPFDWAKISRIFTIGPEGIMIPAVEIETVTGPRPDDSPAMATALAEAA